MIDQIITAAVGIALLGGSYLIDLLFGIVKVMWTADLKWSWKKMFEDLTKALVWALGIIALVAMINLSEWFGALCGAPDDWLGDADFLILMAGVLGGIAWYLSGAAKNAVNFIKNKKSVEIDGEKLAFGTKMVADTVRSYFQSAKDSEPTDEEIQEIISGIGGVLVDPLSRILSDGDNDNGRGWQCCKYTWYLASGIRMNYAPHPDYGPVDGRYLAQYLIDKLGYVRCGKQVGAIFSYVNHTGIITRVNADGTVDANDANWTPLRVASHKNVRLEGKAGLIYACRPEDLNKPNPTPTPTPTSVPTPAPATKPTVPNNPVNDEIKAGDSVVAWGAGTADSYGGGATTRNFPETIMKVIGINNGRYALNQYNAGTVGNVADATGWWSSGQVRKA